MGDDYVSSGLNAKEPINIIMLCIQKSKKFADIANFIQVCYIVIASIIADNWRILSKWLEKPKELN